MTKPGSARAADSASGHDPPFLPHRLTITYELRPDPANPRRHSKARLCCLAQMIKTFGFRVPILRDAAAMFIAGRAPWEVQGRGEAGYV